MLMDSSTLPLLIERYTRDPESVYNTWFVSGEERLKAFRSIRGGVREIVDSIAAGTFGNDFKGSPLEFVLTSITEQKQVFEGAAHPFYWKPKLRIPDIYENKANKQAFGRFLEACLGATREDQVLAEISRLAAAQIKGLGPAAANIVYFLHPTIIPPFNTAMVNGFNALYQDRKKLGSWDSYLGMRATIMQTNTSVRHLLSKDLGAFAGLLYELGTGRLVVEGNADAVWKMDQAKAEQAAKARHTSVLIDQREESAHTHMQHLLITVGRALGYDVYVARNDRHRAYAGESFAARTLPELPDLGWPQDVVGTVGLIDVIWLRRGQPEIVCAFEVEKSTSIYSGILRMQDLGHSIPGCTCHFYLVAPDQREKEVLAQLTRPSIRAGLADLAFAYIPFSELQSQCDALCRFGADHTAVLKIARHTIHTALG